MSQLLVRDLDEEILERLKERARSHGRSLQKEAKAILEAAAGTLTMEEAGKLSAQWHARLGGRQFSDSAELRREDRER